MHATVGEPHVDVIGKLAHAGHRWTMATLADRAISSQGQARFWLERATSAPARSQQTSQKQLSDSRFASRAVSLDQELDTPFPDPKRTSRDT